MSRRRNRAESQRLRDARRESLFVILDRIQRGVTPTPAEAALLRAHVEAETREGDQARRTAAGAQTAGKMLRDRLTAAEAAIVETEQDRDRALALVEQMQTTNGQALDTSAAALSRERTRAETAEQQVAEHEAASLRYANYLADARAACGAPNWPALAETVADLASRAEQAEAHADYYSQLLDVARTLLSYRDRYRAAWHSARRRADDLDTRCRIVKATSELRRRRADTAEQRLDDALTVRTK